MHLYNQGANNGEEHDTPIVAHRAAHYSAQRMAMVIASLATAGTPAARDTVRAALLQKAGCPIANGSNVQHVYMLRCLQLESSYLLFKTINARIHVRVNS